MLVRPYEMPWRPAYELWAAAAWVTGLCFFVFLGGKGLLTASVALGLALFALLMVAHRLRQGFGVLTVRASLSGKAMQIITTRKHAALTRDAGQVFLGFGFEWQPVHSQRLYELAKINYKDYAVPPAVLRLLGYAVNPQPDSEIGLSFIHGVEPREKALYRPLQNFEGGTLLVGTTQSGKGVALGSFLTQAIRRGDVVVFIDPKNSRRLKRIVQRACSDYREADTFLEFHPAFPELGVRLDFTFNWQKPTEIASRIQSIMPVDTGGAFTAFGWDAVNVVVQGLVSLEDRPNLIKLTKYIEGGIEPVLEASLQRHFDACLGPAWRDLPELRALMQAAARGHIKRPSEVATPQLMAYVSYYEQHLPQNRHDKVIDSQIRVFRHNREHYQKITANLLPILSMLTSGDLGGRPRRPLHLQGCHAEDRVGVALKDAYLRTESLSCVRADGTALEVRIQGSVYGEDGKVGMRGRLITKQGQMLANALLAGVVSGIGQGISTANTSYSTSALGSVATTNGSDALKAGLGSGVGKALDRLAQYYIKLAEQTFPIIEIDAGREIDVVLTKGVRIEAAEPARASPTSFPSRSQPPELTTKVISDEE